MHFLFLTNMRKKCNMTVRALLHFLCWRNAWREERKRSCLPGSFNSLYSSLAVVWCFVLCLVCFFISSLLFSSSRVPDTFRCKTSDRFAWYTLTFIPILSLSSSSSSLPSFDLTLCPTEGVRRWKIQLPIDSGSSSVFFLFIFTQEEEEGNSDPGSDSNCAFGSFLLLPLSSLFQHSFFYSTPYSSSYLKSCSRVFLDLTKKSFLLWVFSLTLSVRSTFDFSFFHLISFTTTSSSLTVLKRCVLRSNII